MEDLIRNLLAINNSSQLGIEKTLAAMGHLIDLAGDQINTDWLVHAVGVLETMAKQQLPNEQLAFLHYCRGNAFSLRRHISRQGKQSAWEWQHDDLEQEIISLRVAAKSAVGSRLPPVLQCQILTNLANALNHVGRFVEAVAMWDAALAVDPRFGMAMANKGYGLYHYAGSLYDSSHDRLFLKAAYDCLVAGLEAGVEPGASSSFKAQLDRIRTILPAEFLQHPFEQQAFSLGRSFAERQYREWCLNQRLFLNPVNDLGPHAIAAQDVFSVPSIVMPISEGHHYHGFFNQMKQEFVSARYLAFTGITATRMHFSDKDVLVFDTLDYPSYCLAVEQQKSAFRTAYSLFDKIGFFLNHYMRLGIPERSVGFKTLWFAKQQISHGLRQEFTALENWPLRGLFWLAKDLYDDSPGFREALEPTARRLAEVRNHLEHKYLKVHEDMWDGPPDPGDEARRAISDTLAFSIRRSDLSDSLMLVLRLTRAALIYLSLGVHAEERRRANHRPASHKVVANHLMTWPDRWKL